MSRRNPSIIPGPALVYVFKVEVKSCTPEGGWVGRYQFECPNNGNFWLIAAQRAASEMNVTTIGVRVSFLGLREKENQAAPITPMSPFNVTIERT